MSTSVFVAIMKTSEGYFLMLNNEKPGRVTILGWESMKKAVSYFEGGYNRNHDRGYEPSMSACINFIQFQPHLIEFIDLPDMIQKLGLKEGQSPVMIHSISGNYLAAPLDTELAKPIWEAGHKPRLISEPTEEERADHELRLRHQKVLPG